MDTIFDKIIQGEIPSTMIHEDEQCVVIMDINPVIKGHCLVISRKSYPTFSQCPQEELSHLMEIAKAADAKLRDVLCCDGTNIVINNGPAAGQEVPHLHIHVIPRYTGGKKIVFPHEVYQEGEMKALGEKLGF